MKVRIISLIAVFCVLATLGYAKTKQKTVVASKTNTESPFPALYPVPTAEDDTEEYFAATGIAYGDYTKKGELQKEALTNAQDLIRQKMKHSYKGIVSNFSKHYQHKYGVDICGKTTRGGEQIIDVIVNDTQGQVPMFSPVDEKGNLECYLSIRIYKDDLADRIADFISGSEELRINHDEEQFRRQMKEGFKRYKQSVR